METQTNNEAEAQRRADKMTPLNLIGWERLNWHERELAIARREVVEDETGKIPQTTPHPYDTTLRICPGCLLELECKPNKLKIQRCPRNWCSQRFLY